MQRTFSAIAGAAFLAVLAATASAQEATAKGLQVFTVQKCTACHAIGGKGNKKGPLDDIGAKMSADDIRAWIVDPIGMAAKRKPVSTRKPPMKKKPISEGDVDALVALLTSLKKG